MIQYRDVQLKQEEKFKDKVDKTDFIKAVIVDAQGNDSGTGSVWADENNRRVWIREAGSASISQVPCYNIQPRIGLGVIVGFEINSTIREVLRSDKNFLGKTNTQGFSFEAPTNQDLSAGGRLQLWIATKLIEPLAIYPTPTGLTVNVVNGDYVYQGQRVTFAGQTNVALTQNPNAGEHYYAGLYLDASNALQVVYGASVLLATTPPEPSWPAGAFRLGVVRINDTQTNIVMAANTSSTNDIFDRRMAWSDENSSTGATGEVWLISGQVATTYTTIAAALAAASSGDSILIFSGTYTETLTVSVANLTLTGFGATITNTSGTLTINAAGVTVRNLTIANTGTGLFNYALGWNVNNVTIDSCTVSHTGAGTTGIALWHYGGTGAIVRDTIATDDGASTNSYGYRNDTADSAAEVYGGKISGDTDLYTTRAGSTLVLHSSALGNNVISWAGTIGGWYLNSANALISFNTDIYPNRDAKGLWARFVNYGRTPDEHWAQGSDQITWTGWAAYTGFVTPATITRTDSQLLVDHGSAARAFYYRSYINAQTTLIARVSLQVLSEVGLMVDDGADNADGNGANNFSRFFLECPSATSNWNFATESRAGGGAVTKTTFFSVPPAAYYGLAITYGVGTRWSSWYTFCYLIGEAGQLGYVTYMPATNYNWTPAYHGLYYRNTGGATRGGMWDWYEEA